MPTCSQITDALNTLASATTNPNALSDLSGQTASLAVPYGTPGTVNLSVGGQALLTVPSAVSISGKAFQIIICYEVIPTAAEFSNTLQMYLAVGNPFSGGNPVSLVDLSIPNSVTAGNGLIVFTGVWDSSSQQLSGYTNKGSSFPDNSSSSFSPFSVSSQSGLQFGLWVDTIGAATDPQNVLTITQFKLQLI